MEPAWMENTNASTIALPKTGKGRKSLSGHRKLLNLRLLARLLGAAAVLIFFVYPILKLILLSFQGEHGLTLDHYANLLQQDRFWSTLRNTAVIVIGSTVFSLVLGTAFAWIVAYTDIRYKGLLHMAVLLCFILPSYVLTLSWSSFMGAQGWVAQGLRMIHADLTPWSMYSMGSIIFVMGIHHFPLVYLFTLDVFRKIPRDLEWAARAGGAGRLKTIRQITLPLALPGLTAGGLLVFLASLDNFGIPAFLGSPVNISVLSTLIYEEIIGFGPSAFARGASLSVMLGVAAVIGSLIQWILLRKSHASDTIQPDHAPRYALGKMRKPLSAVLWGFLLLVTVVPLASMVSMSLKRAYGLGLTPANFTLDNYRYILFENERVWQAIQNSLVLSGVTMLVCLVLGCGFAYMRVRKPTRFNKAAELATAVPYTLPGIVFALSMILVWMEPIPGWNPGIYGSMTILFIAYICRFLILQIRSGITSFMQLDASMEEAARVSGAGAWRKWTAILLPLLLPGILTGGLLVFLTALTELTVSALLYASGSQTIGVTIFSFEQAGNTLYSTALSSLIVLLIGIGGAGLLLVQRWAARKGFKA
ncbi:ABC transporter permease subunit [Paenibacillus campinasensis]|uniref:ABC transporter permease subunit n=1 Tax=Paenibacillus campinasensis TaxID=66347 RepID=A0ABW9T3S6_9BACL|nr:iron ABC transporter permease [Paenibacillus campinasensis]MUG67091.1 ABC transporter permease subunit [Paenibacillus campinasensis]